MLFRSEVLSQRADRLSGSVSVAVPVAWQAIGYLLFVGVAAAIAFVSLAQYARVETVGGAVVPDAGVSAILPTRSGVITSIAVREGQVVPAGADLAMIRAEEDGAGGVSAASRLEAAIAQQDANLGVQAGAAQAAASAQLGQLVAQRAGFKAEILQIQSQIAFQQGLIASASRDVERGRALSAQGFMSPRELQNRDEALLSRQQVLAQLQQALEARRSALAEAEKAAAQVSAQARAQVASLAASRAEVAQLAASTNGSRAYVLRAPITGRIAALTARVGSPASPQAPLMTIVPVGSVLRAELAVPSAAIGFTKPGQAVRLAIDAFPYQRFGTVSGRILTVASSPMSQRGANGSVISVYPVRVALADDHVVAFGRREALVPGMTLTARIITERQSLLEWLFEPLFAVRRR